jgi:hypothetical protein
MLSVMACVPDTAGPGAVERLDACACPGSMVSSPFTATPACAWTCAAAAISEGVLRHEYLARVLQDGLEVLRWIAKRPCCSGTVGLFGFSSCPPDPAVVGERWREMWLERLEAERAPDHEAAAGLVWRQARFRSGAAVGA